MNVREIVKEYLTAKGFNGLAGDNCGCGIDDLVPCDSSPMECVPAYKRECKEDDCGECHADCYGYADNKSHYRYESATDPLVEKNGKQG